MRSAREKIIRREGCNGIIDHVGAIFGSEFLSPGVERITVRLNINVLITRLMSLINVIEFQRTLFYSVTVKKAIGPVLAK